MIIQKAQSEDLLLPISRSCVALEVSRSGYYEWLKQYEKITTENFGCWHGARRALFRSSMPSRPLDTGRFTASESHDQCKVCLFHFGDPNQSHDKPPEP